MIVPAHRSPVQLARCIAALRESELPQEKWELIVADDGSDDRHTESIAREADLAVTLPPPPSGPARARNEGARLARADILAFVDADVLVHRDGLSRMLAAFRDRSVAAVFGSYDDRPEHPGTVSTYRNLLHHRVHQQNAGDAESFWAGCGAVRKTAFAAVGMFDEKRYRRPEMEDVELGYRLRDAGHRIVLDPRIQCTHLKAWTLGGMIRSDFTRRGLPWARLLHERKMLLAPRGLSLGATERASALAALLAAIAAVAAIFTASRTPGAFAAVLLLAFIALNRRLFAWLAEYRGIWFALKSIPLHIAYNLVAVTALAWGAATAALSRPSGRTRYTPRR